ncbi:hypothetical protein Tco_0525808 [Tanacetum coccineum]
MATMAENVIAAGSENRPSMLKKGMYDSWKTQIILYIRGKENGEMLKDSINNGPFQLKPKITAKDTNGVTDICRPQKDEDPTQQEKLRYDSDIKTQECESMLYDEFDKFTSEPGESIYSYYLRYVKLINDMNMIPMYMSPMQINTKFVNHHQPEWSRFVTAAKQARDLNTVNFDQLHAINHSASGKLHDKSVDESWELIENLALYDHKSWNDPRDLAKPVKAIFLPQDVPSTSDHHVIELENQVQCLMETHLAPKPSVQVNKIASSCEICGGHHNTQYCMENPKQAFVDYASSRIDEAEFEADFKQQQSKVTNKIDTLLKAINDRMTRALSSDTVKNLKLNVNPTYSVLFTRSYPMENPQSSSHPFNSVNAVKMCFKSTNDFQKDQLHVKTLTVNEIVTPKSKKPKRALEDEFKDLHLKLPVLEVLAHALMYTALFG